MSSNDDLFPPAYGYLYAVANPTWSGLVKLGQGGISEEAPHRLPDWRPHTARTRCWRGPM